MLYGTSAGALTGAGQLAAGLGIYAWAACRGLIDVLRVLVGVPAFRVSEIIDEVIRTYLPDVVEQALPVRVTAARVADKGLARVALGEGATHVLVLRSRHAWNRKPELRGWRQQGLDRFLRRVPDSVREMVYERLLRHNAGA